MNDVSELQIDVRWRPEGADANVSHDKSFRGDKAVTMAEAVGHFERNYLTLTTIKHPDRAESTRFWNFNLTEIQAVLVELTDGAVSDRDTIIQVDVGYQALIISSENGPVVRIHAHTLLKLHRTDFSSASAG